MPNYYDNYTDPFQLSASSFNTELDKLDAAIKVNADAIASSGTEFDAASLLPQGRLSLSSTLAVTTNDVTAATTLYYQRYVGKFISIYNGVTWVAREIPAALSIAVPATTNTNYDVYAYWTGAALALELVAWTNNTTRATALTRQDGIRVKSGDTGRRYIGTIRTTGVSGQCEDSDSRRFVFNAYNRVTRFLSVIDQTNSWTYTTGAYRQARASTLNEVEVVVGLSEDLVRATATGTGFSTAPNFMGVGVGINSTSANSAQVMNGWTGSSAFGMMRAEYKGYLAVGYNEIVWLEYGTTGATFYGDNGLAIIQSGLMAEVMA